MKKFLFLTLLNVWCMAIAAQTPVYVFRFQKISFPESNSYVKGTGKLTIYDNLKAELSVKAGSREVRKSITFSSFSFNFAGGFFNSTSDKSREETEPRIMLAVSGITAVYSDERDGDYIFGAMVSDADNHPNRGVYEKMKSDMDENRGIFSSFRSISEMELPLRFEVPDGLRLKADDASKGEYSGLATHEGGLVGIILKTKTGKYPADAGLSDYDVEITPMNGQTADWVSIHGKQPNVLAIKIDPNYSQRSRAVNLYLKIGGKVQGRLFVLQLAEGSQINW